MTLRAVSCYCDLVEIRGQQMKAYKLRFYPTLKQRKQLAREFNCCRFVWNWALSQRINAYRNEEKTLNAVALSRMLTLLKVSTPFLKRASATTLINVLWSLDDAYSRFIKKQNKFPKFKKRHHRGSCCYQLDKRRGAQIFVDQNLVVLPKLGKCKIVWSTNINVMPDSATASKDAKGRYWISFQVNEEINRCDFVKTNKTIGIDLGLKYFIATSDGLKIKPLKPLKASLRQLQIQQRKLSKKVKGSNNRKKQRVRVARIHAQIADQRVNFCHQISTSICRHNDAVTIEDLYVKGMLANRKLSRSISDVSWSEFTRQLKYKSQWYHRELTMVPRFQRTTGVCPTCGIVGKRLPLNVRNWDCICGATHDRDIAAAKVIDQIGNRARSVRIEA